MTQIIDALEHPVGQGSELAISSQAARRRVAKGDWFGWRLNALQAQGSSRALFRLWGQSAITENEAPVEAVDLHVGHWTGIELGRDWTRVYLRAGSCGNTVSRRGRVLAQVADQADDVVGDEPPDGTA